MLSSEVFEFRYSMSDLTRFCYFFPNLDTLRHSSLGILYSNHALFMEIHFILWSNLSPHSVKVGAKLMDDTSWAEDGQ